PDALHGGPVAALIARASESHPSDQPMFVARLTVELLRPVPLAALTVRTTMLRPGRRVQLVETTVAAGDTGVARAVALRIRHADLPEARTTPEQVPWPDPEGLAARVESIPTADESLVAFHSHAVEMRFVAGHVTQPGPATVWMRLRYPVIAGEVPTPLQRVAAVADFGNGVSSVLPWQRWTFINPDLTIGLHRLPGGEWVGLDAVTRIGASGVGQAESLLFDQAGPLGRAVQSLFVDPV
ncbi:MAG TPA: thioesterase family protein, partial [Acidimicrobiales bacterium]|nr:thioesterase family protein [Acidimicrobiales bacterium]